MKVIVVGARVAGDQSEARGYTLSAQAHEYPDRHSDSILLVHWRLDATKASAITQQLAASSGGKVIWDDIEPNRIVAAEEVPVGEFASNRYADHLYTEAELAINQSLDM
jgi:hypothetical protein